jgi:RHS repeat-associated protein
MSFSATAQFRSLATLLFMMVCLLPAAGQQTAPPSLTFGTASLIDPSTAMTYYNGQGMTSVTRTLAPEFDVLRTARALGNDPDRIYAFVRNEIDVIPLFGVKAGARGALIDKAGTPFDQAHLMVELLRAAGVPATYQLGTITLTGAQFNEWFGISNTTAATRLLADGGFPATVSGGATVTSVTMLHLWVRATIGGSTYVFDPAFKPHTVKTGINLDSVMGFSGSAVLSSALTGAASQTTNATAQLRDVNRTSLRSTLQAYAVTLLNHIKVNWPNGEIGDIVGSRTITPYVGAPLRQSTLAYPTSAITTFANDVPSVLRTKVVVNYTYSNGAGVQQPPPNHTYHLDEIYGEQLGAVPLYGAPGPAYFVYLKGKTKSGLLRGLPNLRASINHPYAANSGAYMDRSLNSSSAEEGGAVHLLIGTGKTSTDLGALLEARHDGEEYSSWLFDPGSEEGAIEIAARSGAKRRMAAMYLSQLSAAKDMLGRVGNATVQMHDALVSVATFAVPKPGSLGYAGTSISVNLDAGFSVAAHDGSASTQAGVSRAMAFVGSALEGSVTQQAFDSPFQVSTVAKFDWMGTSDPYAPPPSDPNSRWFYYADASNWAWVKTQLLADYSAPASASYSSAAAAEYYINAGYSLIIPRSSDLGPGNEIQDTCNENPNFPMVACDVPGLDRGGAFIALKPDGSSIGHVVARGPTQLSKGGGGTDDVQTSPNKVFNVPEDFLDRQFTARAESFNVDLKSGKLTYSPPADITVGNGGYPYSLSFQRTFTSGSYAQEGELDSRQYGWTNNFDRDFKLTSDGMNFFGEDRPERAAMTIVMMKALVSLMGSTTPGMDALQRHLVSAGVSQWWSDQTLSNTVVIKGGTSSRSFVKLADGTWASPVGDAASLEVFGNRVVVGEPGGFKQPYVKYSTVCGRVIEKDRSFSLYGGWTKSGAGLTVQDWTCTASTARSFHDQELGPTAPLTSRLFRAEVFPFGVVVEASSDGSVLSNSLGRSLSMSGSSWNFSVSDQQSGRSINVETQGDRGSNTQVVTDLVGGVWKYRNTPGLAGPEFPSTFEVFPPSTPLSALFRFAYEEGERGRVKTVSDALGQTSTYWISTGRIASTVDPFGSATRVTHDRFGNLVRVEDPLGRISDTAYDNHQRKSRETAPEGNAVSYTYDARSNVLTTTVHAKPGATDTPPEITKSTATYDTLCNIKLSDTDALDNTTSWTINQTTCLVTQLTQPKPTPTSAHPITTYSYSVIGKMTQKEDPTGLVTLINYDNVGNPTSVIVDPVTDANPHESITTVFTYDSIGNIVSLTDPRGKTHTGTYDALRRLTTYTGPTSTGVSTTWTYNVDGLITSISKANGANPSVTSYTYWPTGRVKTMTDPDNRVSRYDYDAANRLTYTTDPELRRTLKVYNAASEVIEERRGIGTPNVQAYASFTYTLNGKQATIKDARDNQTTYQYDGLDRPKKTIMPDSSFEEVILYDNVDNVRQKSTRRGQVIVNTYDDLNRLATHSVPQFAGSPVTTNYTYDLAGRALTVYDSAGQGLTYGLDSAKRVKSVAQSAPNITGTRTVTYELDKAGNKTRANWPDLYYVTYQFDDINRMTTVTENGTFVLAAYVWDPLSRRASLAYGNDTTQSFSYSKAGDLETQTQTLSGTSNTWTNSYTKAHQLLSEAASNAAWVFQPAVNETTTYGQANNLNQYVNVTHAANPTATLYYDGNGNLIDDGAWDFEYDAENRLTKASNATSGTTAQYLYDPMGRRQAKIVGNMTTSFLSDGAEEIAEYDGAGGLLRRYIPGPGTDQPIAMVTPSGGSHQHSYFHTNRQGSTVAMSNDAGTVAEGPYTYDAYGQGAPSAGVPFKYTGRRLDPETGLYYYRARYYSAALGRFLQTDPIGYQDQMNLYGYVNNDPGNATDPSGEDTVVELKSYTIGNQPIVGDFGHQYVEITDTDTGLSTIARAGPSAPYPQNASALVSPAADPNGNGNITLKTSVTPSMQSVDYGQNGKTVPGTKVTIGEDYSHAVEKVKIFSGAVDNANIPYQPTSTNSNAFAGAAYEVLTGEEAPSSSNLPGSEVSLQNQIPACSETKVCTSK